MEHYQKNQISYCVNAKGHKIPPYESNYTQQKTTLIQRIIKYIFG